MARPLSEPQRAELAAFIDELYRLGGFATWAEFSRESGYPATNLSNVHLAKKGIDGPNLLGLIRAVARRTGAGVAEVALAAAPAAQEDLEGILARLLLGQAQILERIDEARRRERPEPTVMPRPSKTARKKT